MIIRYKDTILVFHLPLLNLLFIQNDTQISIFQHTRAYQPFQGTL